MELWIIESGSYSIYFGIGESAFKITILIILELGMEGIVGNIPGDLIAVLGAISELLDKAGVRWILAGSLGLAIQGVAVLAHDIDIISDAAGAFKIGELLHDHVIKPVEWSEGEEFASYFGQVSLNGVLVEIMGDLQAWEGDSWHDLSSRLENPVLVRMEGIVVPVSSLEDELKSYRSSGRVKDLGKAAAIERVLKRGS